jgi:hypothetical protein
MLLYWGHLCTEPLMCRVSLYAGSLMCCAAYALSRSCTGSPYMGRLCAPAYVPDQLYAGSFM